MHQPTIVRLSHSLSGPQTRGVLFSCVPFFPAHHPAHSLIEWDPCLGRVFVCVLVCVVVVVVVVVVG